MSDGNSHLLMALGRHDGGKVVEVADEKLAEVMKQVRDTGKKGTLKLTIAIAPNGEKGFALTMTVDANAPALSFGQSFYYSDKQGRLTRNENASDHQFELVEMKGKVE